MKIKYKEKYYNLSDWTKDYHLNGNYDVRKIFHNEFTSEYITFYNVNGMYYLATTQFFYKMHLLYNEIYGLKGYYEKDLEKAQQNIDDLILKFEKLKIFI